MTPQRIRLIDRWLGIPACAVLSCVERVRVLVVPAPDSRPQRILYVKLIEMGSTVLAAHAFQEAIRRVGREHVFMLVFRRNRPIADIMGLLPPEHIIEVDDTSFRAFAVSLWQALGTIRRARIDTAIDLEGLTRASAVITWLTGARRRVGFYNFTAEGPYRGRLFTHELNITFQHHVSALFLALTRAAFNQDGERPLLKEPVTVPETPLPRFEPDAAARERMARAAGLDPDAGASARLVILNPNCSDLLPLRRWPTERFVTLGQRLLADDPAVRLVISGAPDEQEAAESIAAAIDPDGTRCRSLAGRTSFDELMTLLAIGDVLVSNDSGPCHFAALTDIAVVALFGPETPLLYGPLGQRVRNLSANLACSPCVNVLNHRFSPCRNNRCMHAIAVDTVLEAVRQCSREPANPE